MTDYTRDCLNVVLIWLIVLGVIFMIAVYLSFSELPPFA